MRLLASLCVCLTLQAASSQTATPSSHWGSVTLPELGERQEVGLHFIGFTQYGKEVSGDPPEYSFRPYNDIDETLGFNVLTYTRSGRNERYSTARNDVSTRTSVMAGIVDDRVTEWLQNRVVHWSNLRTDSLNRVPRRPGDTFKETSLGPTKAVPIIGISKEYILRLQSTRRSGGQDRAVPTPFFIGGGVGLSTINHEAFVQGGANVVRADLRPRGPLNRSGRELGLPGVLVLSSIGVGGMARTGILAPSVHFDDLTAGYTNVQAVLGLGLEVYRVPVELDISMTSTEGFFVASRTEEEEAEVEDIGADSEKVYSAKTPMRERFLSLRFRAGGFTVETYNDLIGGKDKGPSFGVGLNLMINPLGRRR